MQKKNNIDNKIYKYTSNSILLAIYPAILIIVYKK